MGAEQYFIELSRSWGSTKWVAIGQEAIQFIAASYLRSATESIDLNQFMIKNDDPDRELKLKFLEAVKKISGKYMDRLPMFAYETLAFMGTRPEPTREVRVPDVETLLPSKMDWKQVDTFLHALPLCSRLNLDILSTIHQHAGCIIVHGCGCNHAIPETTEDQVVRSVLRHEAIVDETESFARHSIAQYALLLAGFPQGFGVSHRGQKVAQASESFIAKYVLRPDHHYVTQ